MNVIEHLTETMAAYKATYGEPQYKYFKRLIVWTRRRRERGGHVSPISNGEEVSREEFDANIVHSQNCSSAAFRGHLQGNYWEYHRKMAVDGWREHLVKDLDAIVVSNGTREGAT